VYDYLVVGAGLFGTTFARLAADHLAAKCLVIDKRPHIGGNCYSERVDGIDVHRYGPHIFHTNDLAVWKWIQQFGTFEPFVNTSKAVIGDQVFSWPVNRLTLCQLAGRLLSSDEMLFEESFVSPTDLNFEQYCIRRVGGMIYRLFYRDFTRKMWGVSPTELPASIAARIPVRHTFDDRYYPERWVGVPSDGWGALLHRMLDGIEVRLDTSFDDLGGLKKATSIARRIVYTGRIDEFFGYRFGILPYRTLHLETEYLDGTHHGACWLTYPSADVAHTRIVEHKLLNIHQVYKRRTIVTKETPDECVNGTIPMYPVPTEANRRMLLQYQKEARNQQAVVFGGRLGQYLYLNMDRTIRLAAELANVGLTTGRRIQ